MWVVAGPLIAFKVGVVVLLLMYAPTREGLLFVLGTGWPVLIVVAVMVAGPLAAWYRLVRVRARRNRLRRSEWMGLEPGAPALARPADEPQWPLWETVSRLEGGD